MNDAHGNGLTKARAEGHEYLLRFADRLDEGSLERFSRQLDDIDYELVERLAAGRLEAAVAVAAENIAPAEMIPLPRRLDALEKRWHEARQVGRRLLAEGGVAALLIAGGQGSRLGYEHPKGTYPIGPVSEESLFEHLAGQVLATSRRYGATVPLYVMTSDATHDETVKYFQDNDYLGLDAGDVMFFRQGMLPAVDSEGRMLLDGWGHVFVSPDGHGGCYRALEASGALAEMKRRGIDLVSFFQVDNPLVNCLDPAFLGFHEIEKAEMSFKVLRKRDASEPVGVPALVDGEARIIEYSDLPEKIENARDQSGELVFWAGSINVILLSLGFIRRINVENLELPYHVAHKKIPHLDAGGALVEPSEANGYKFERFVFDAMAFAKGIVFVEVAREDEFAPVKNAAGADSPETCREALTARARRWCDEAGVSVEGDGHLEISALFALDAQEFAAKAPTGKVCAPHIWEVGLGEGCTQ